MELFKLLGTVAIDNQGANKALDDTVGKAEGAHGKISAAFDKIGSAAVAVGKVMATGLAAGAAATGALVKSAVDAYADYEQLVGGVETLFKDSADAVKQYAADAYKTAGLSANEYMETVTSFSASLLQGLDGDTVKAAEIADRAITDMADNANKMGTSISMIQNAYQGFAKQNYTMLDNLKLGYGGTQAEMARLINESGVLGDTITVTAETVNEVSFDQIIKAIGIVQDRMGITGTTAKEASSTITGSLASAKSAWKNLLTGIADDEADFEGLIDDFVESVGVASENVIERVEIALEGSAKLIDRLFPVIAEKIPAIINDVLPDVLRSAVSIVQNLVNGISANKDTIMQTAFDAVMVIIQTITEMLPQIFELGIELLVTIAEGIVDNLDKLVESASEMVGKIVDTITKPDTLKTLLGAALTIIVALAGGIIDALPELADASIEVITQIGEFLTDSENLEKLLDAALKIILAIGEALAESAPELITAAGTIIQKLIEFLVDEDNRKKIIETGSYLVGKLAGGLLEGVGAIGKSANEIADVIVDTIFETDWVQVGLDIIDGIARGMMGDFWDDYASDLGLADKSTDESSVSGAGRSGRTEDSTTASGAGRSGRTTSSNTTTASSKNAKNSKLRSTGGMHMMAEGGVLEAGQVGLLEGNGAEAVVPLERNKKWISAVARDMESVSADGSEDIRELKDAFKDFAEALPDMLVEAFASMKFDVNKREFARLVKVVE